MTSQNKPDFWEMNFSEKQEMWGFEPSHSAELAKDLFLRKKIKKVLIPGFGYGRNAQVFLNNGMAVTGIEISKTAIELARKHYGAEIIIHHGSVAEMPFDDARYDGIFCYALIHLLDKPEREKLLRDCFNQLAENGYMVFTAVTKEAPIYGQGSFIEPNRYEVFEGVNMFFYDRETIKEKFGPFGLLEIAEIRENYPFYLITCKKSAASRS